MKYFLFVSFILGSLIQLSEQYTPSSTVEQAHKIPHLTWKFQPSNSQFTFTESYLVSLLPFPALILAITILVCLLFVFALAIRCCVRYICCCFPCCKPKPKEPNPNIAIHRKNATIAFLIVLVSTFVVTFFIFLGNSQLTSAFNNISSSIDTLGDLVTAILTAISNLVNATDELSISATSQSCAALSANDISYISTYDSQISGSADSIQSLSSSIHNSIDQFSNTISSTAVQKKDLVTGIFVGVIMLLMIFFSCGMYFKNTLLFQIGIFINWFVVLAIFIIASLVMTFVMLIADFCMDPTTNLMSAFPAGSQTNDVILYYSSCVGTNPFESYLTTISTTMGSIQSELNTVSSSIPADCNNLLMSNFSVIQTSVYSLDNSTTCGPLNQFYNEAFITGLCENGFTGLYNYWLILFLVAALLFVLMCLANLIYSHYKFTDEDFLLSKQADDPDQEYPKSTEFSSTTNAATLERPDLEFGQIKKPTAQTGM